MSNKSVDAAIVFVLTLMGLGFACAMLLLCFTLYSDPKNKTHLECVGVAGIAEQNGALPFAFKAVCKEVPDEE